MLAFILPFAFVKAEVKEDGKTISQGWYVGVEGGMPFGFSTFSSFGHDKTHLGWAAGLYGGYRFNSIFSAELSAKYGEVNMSAQDCCVERNYWLGSDGVRYKAGVLGMDSWEYANLKSHVRMGRYGAGDERFCQLAFGLWCRPAGWLSTDFMPEIGHLFWFDPSYWRTYGRNAGASA